MVADWQIRELIELAGCRYEGWGDFDHPDFVADEVAYKQATIAKAREQLSKTELDRLIAADAFEAMIERLDRLGKDNNLLWRQVPSVADTAVLHHPNLDKATFCTQLRNLLYADRPTPDRLQTFTDYAAANGLPNKWPFPTYFLFICQPRAEMFVKPRAATWFLKFMGESMRVVAPPDGATYATIRQHAHALFDALRPYGARDMVDVQSLIWVCYQESKGRIGRLDAKGQVDLDVPPTTYEVSPQVAMIRESMAKESEVAKIDTITPKELVPPYTLAQCAADTGFTEAELGQWVKAIERKKQVVFYGPPGTSKTFVAEKLARHLVGGGDGFSELVQFHPAFAYEDFMQGIRPFTQPDGSLRYDMVPGRFKQFCEKARGRNGRCLLIIDEINRANTASVFGELMYLLEYRDREIPLSGGGTFSIPANVYIIGTMNTADRSIALVDHALRRRFAFIPLYPNFDILRRYHAQSEFNIDGLITTLQRLNNQIGDPHYHVGHSFFLHPDLAAQIADIWRMEIEPYLEEYFFDQQDQMDTFRWEQIRSSQSQSAPDAEIDSQMFPANRPSHKK